jgi:colicin import membrane protein
MPIRGGRILGGILASTLLFFAQARAENNSISQLNEITIDEVDDELVIGVKGTKLPDFTSFTMHEPYRVVIDWAGSELSEAPKTQAFERGLIRSIVTEQFSSESEKISRIVIELAVHTRYRFETIGREVFVHFKKVAIPLGLDAKSPEEANKAEDFDPNQAAIASLGDEPIPDGPLTEPSEVPSPPPPALVAPVSEELLADIAEPNPDGALLVAKPSSPLKAAPPKRTKETTNKSSTALARLNAASNIAEPEVVRLKTTKLAKSQDAPIIKEAAAAKPQGDSPGLPTVRLASSANLSQKAPPKPLRLAKITRKGAVSEKVDVEEIEIEEIETEEIETEEIETEEARSPVAIAVQPKPVSNAAKTEPRNNKSPVMAASPASRDKTTPIKGSLGRIRAKSQPTIPPVLAKTKRLAQLNPETTKKLVPIPPKPQALKPVVRPSPPSAKSFAPSRKSSVKRATGKVTYDGMSDFKPGKRVMKYIGFRQKAAVSEVFIRCDGKAQFRVVEDSKNKLVVELFDTEIRVKNNQRALDTSFFPTAVRRVHAKSDSSGTRVEISLRHRVPYEVKRVGSTIKLLFNNAAR